ncbi:transcriptional regulator, AraC family with amidase-like domain [Streptomyces sp. 2231.1]|uniref:GlxA family transcriptional regulator n=1 Tax=Streptomyces sp. 2231.1 TaxID=1855347 RepID=UPI00089C3055|nr:DJ-1/PfpI family protein [Streptomyces sp. 2231.1]SEC09375.1 transcriptional regulator, AraC family with amidase-like domain [Streptomyces sp. 2231.1]
MKGRPSGGKPLLVTVLVFPGVRLLDVTGPIEVFASANEFGGRYRMRMVSPNGADVVTAAGTGLGVDLAAADVDYVSDVVVVPGGPEWPSLIKDDALLDAVRALDARSRRTASICTGAFLLAAAGLLDGREATTHWRFADQLALRYPRVTVDADALYVRDGHIMTSAGVSSGIDLSLALVEEHLGADTARAVAKDMVVFMQRPGGQSQFSVRTRTPHTRQELLRRILDAVAEDPSANHTLAAMARRAGVSARHLTRLFHEDMATTPARYVEQVRMEAAQAMLEGGDDPMASVAHRTGFGSPESLRRAFTRNLGITPGAYRKRFRTTNAARAGEGN